tara:strand:+ start:411 stop:707 length:297 start_codon:yes stop_codon:yes gene_type:complete
MKRLLLPLLAAITLPIAVNAESYKAGLAKIQLPKMQKLLENAKKFIEIKDYDAACSKFSSYDFYLESNFEGLQELLPNTDWFEVKQNSNRRLEICGYK